MPYAVRALLTLDGVRVPDAAADASRGPVALADLSIRWGRDSSDSQPDPSTCSFSVWDERPNGGELSSLVRAGVAATVYAYGTRTYPKSGFLADPISTWPAYAPDTEDRHGHVWPLYGMTASVVNPGTRYVHGKATDSSKMQALVLGMRDFGPPYMNVPPFSAWQQFATSVTLGQYAPVGAKVQTRLYSYDVVTDTITPTTAVSPVMTTTGNPNQNLSYVFNRASIASLPGRPAIGLEILPVVATKWSDVAGAWSAQTQTWQQFPMGIAADFRIPGFLGYDYTNPVTAEYYTNVFQGRITDVTLTPDAGGSVMAQATAVDIQAEWAHRYIGDEPWLSEAAALRSNRISDLAGVPHFTMPNPQATWPVSWRDVDKQSTMDLFRSLADTVDMVLWTKTGWDAQTLFYENPSARTALLQLAYVNPYVVIVANPNQPATIPLSACDVLQEPTTVTQDTENIVSIVDLTWQEQLLEDGLPAPTERHVVLQDEDALEAYGTRRLGVSTELTLETTAAQVANQVLVRSREVDWQIPSLVWDTAAGEGSASLGSLFSLLDGTARIAAPLALSDLPEWSPIGTQMVCWIEGGTYTYDGYWTLNLSVAPASSGGKSVDWNSLKVSPLVNYGWNVYDPEIDWRDLVGVAAPPPS